MLSHGQWQQAARTGGAIWMCLLPGMLTKLALVFTMIGLFAFVYFARAHRSPAVV